MSVLFSGRSARFCRRAYHSYEHKSIPAYPDPENEILAAALKHVPEHGFTRDALTLGVKGAGYGEISANLFHKPAFDIVKYHLVTQRLRLKERIQFPDKETGVGRKVKGLVLERLRGNVQEGIVPRWPEGLALMSLAENIAPSLRELSLLSDEIWFLAGDVSVDSSWYTKRASLAGVYAATEVYQTTDQSTNFADTEQFLDRRLEELRTVGGVLSGAGKWAGFQAGAMVNLLRSKGLLGVMPNQVEAYDTSHSDHLDDAWWKRRCYTAVREQVSRIADDEHLRPECDQRFADVQDELISCCGGNYIDTT
nr:ubiquinone biosynthesis protein coq9, mitochondrial [Quercus suber]